MAFINSTWSYLTYPHTLQLGKSQFQRRQHSLNHYYISRRQIQRLLNSNYVSSRIICTLSIYFWQFPSPIRKRDFSYSFKHLKCSKPLYLKNLLWILFNLNHICFSIHRDQYHWFILTTGVSPSSPDIILAQSSSQQRFSSAVATKAAQRAKAL